MNKELCQMKNKEVSLKQWRCKKILVQIRLKILAIVRVLRGATGALLLQQTDEQRILCLSNGYRKK